MPKYDYACFACDLQQEFDLSFDHWPPLCPKCNYVMARVYQPPGIIFKGKGFYKTDNG